MNKEVNNNEDYLDSRDIIARIEELESECEEITLVVDEIPDLDNETEEQTELRILKALAEECEGYGDWQHGETLIRDSYFPTYAKETAKDCVAVDNWDAWPMSCISWERAAEQLQQDYMIVDFDGVSYWMRA